MSWPWCKGLISTIHEKLQKLEAKKKKLINNQIKKWTTEPNKHFSKEDINRQQIYEKMLNILTHQEFKSSRENQNHNEITLHSSKNGY
jgi:hypothetical protein